jgi:hypothetical protein
MSIVTSKENSSEGKEIAVIPKASNAIRPASESVIVVPRPKPKPNVIDEDSYIDSLDQIIQRDFYPDLPKLRNQLEWLQAEETGDIVKMREIHNRLKGRTTGSGIFYNLL